MTDSTADVLRYLQKLHEAADNYIGQKNFTRVQFFYRNKPQEYFENVKRHNHTMAKLKKDNNGDRRSPINGKLSGVFLGVTLMGGRLPPASPFGETRIQFPIEAIFDRSVNLYFTDFYCSTSSQHYVTIVMTKRGSSEDVFCRRHLLELDKETNPFLRMSASGYYDQKVFQTINKRGLIVEVLYTEKINIGRLIQNYGTDRVFYSRTDIIGRGTSTWGGLRKNVSCAHCNPKMPSSYSPRGVHEYDYGHYDYDDDYHYDDDYDYQPMPSFPRPQPKATVPPNPWHYDVAPSPPRNARNDNEGSSFWGVALAVGAGIVGVASWLFGRNN